MAKQVVVTIGRQFGSGGHEIGNLLAERLDKMCIRDRSVMTPVDFLILDEHTAALDPKTADRIMELTEQIVREKKLTTIMVTHNLRYAVE